MRSSDVFDIGEVAAPTQAFKLSPGGGDFEGLLDELRLYAVVPSDDWIALEVDSATSPDYLTMGRTETAPR